ncbi:MAG: Hsp20/alpha crystallin family protein [Prolixibacteraceae bacterium]|nr:Hsp20/alpha crystallin family protein [Prolixibacteraceae bacterium]MBN2649923.1 Hsp20/alpha crystallin family protein [Prolixibacteraceae bacterium]
MTLARRTNNTFPSFPSIFDRFFNEGLMDWNNLNFSNTDTTIPAVNVKEDDDKYKIEVAVPGMKKEDFNVKLENNMLTISSEHKDEKDESKGGYTRKEFSYQSFQRSFSLPDGHVLADKISAKYNDGILHIELPKRDEVKPQPAKTIKIS